MSAEPQVQYFLGANTPRGFYSLYDELIDPAGASDIFILKGGPGCGKSTLMRSVSTALEHEGQSAEYILCSGDPSSLDAVLFPKLKTAIVDGTAPHVSATKGHSRPLSAVSFVILSSNWTRRNCSAKTK